MLPSSCLVGLAVKDLIGPHDFFEIFCPPSKLLFFLKWGGLSKCFLWALSEILEMNASDLGNLPSGVSAPVMEAED